MILIPIIAKPLTEKHTGKYIVPSELIMTGNAILVSTYLASMRQATLFNEANGSIRSYMEFLGYSKNTYHKATDIIAGIRKALGQLADQGYILGSAKRLRTIPATESFIYPFGAGLGWRREATSQDAKFGVREIQTAIRLAKNVRWNIRGNMADIYLLVAYLRMQRDLNAYAPGITKRDRRNIGVLDLDAVAAALQWTPQDLIIRLKFARNVHLCGFRLLELEPEQEGQPNKRFLFFSDHGREGNKTITNAVKRMKEIQHDRVVVYDSHDPRKSQAKRSEVSL